MLHELSTLPGQTLHDVDRDGIHVVHSAFLDAVARGVLMDDSHDVGPEVHLLLLHLLAQHSTSATRRPHDLWRSSSPWGVRFCCMVFHKIMRQTLNFFESFNILISL